MAMVNHLEFFTGLRGVHVYSNAINWKPYQRQKVTFKREQKNPSDKFAVARKIPLKGMIGLIIVGQAPKSYLAIFGISFQRKPNLKLKYTT